AFSVGLDLETRGAIAVPKRTCAGHLDAADLGRLLVVQADFSFERATDSGDAKLHLKLVGVRRRLRHAPTTRYAPGQDDRIVERNPQRIDRCGDGFRASDFELHAAFLTD